MASRTVGLIQDQNLNVQFNGKANVSKAQRKAGIGGRKPLGDLSNSVKPTPNQTSKKEIAKIIPFSEKEIGAFNLTHDSSKKKRLSLTPSRKCKLLAGKLSPTFPTQAMSPPRYVESNKMTAMLLEEQSPPKHMLSRKHGSFAASPEPLDHHMQWDDPKFLKDIYRAQYRFGSNASFDEEMTTAGIGALVRDCNGRVDCRSQRTGTTLINTAEFRLGSHLAKLQQWQHVIMETKAY
ncbi:hypothetical protein V6N12_025523 [Hibiscus sabdariffa]|uniref:Uncharacterized protein n=1 Tax=Hibiscus sabdariffa TaxID=183260 RepID=A0ABR2CIQ2_9ROSI